MHAQSHRFHVGLSSMHNSYLTLIQMIGCEGVCAIGTQSMLAHHTGDSKPS